jgi:hypothetical protein
MRASRLMAFALTIAVIVIAMIVAGCTTTGTPAPTQAPSATPTPVPPATPTPANQTVDKTYQLVERYAAGIDDYNTGVGFVNTSMSLFNASDYANASSYMDMAADKMAAAKTEFEAMLWYASTSQETLLSQTWTDTADLYGKSYQNASLAYKEYAYEHTRPTPNYVKYEYYIQLAQHYNDLAADSRKQAEAIGNGMTFVVPTSTPVK